ncbi:MAG: hypothetical protein ACREBI_10135 [Nitrosotalea sp.]
MKTLQILRLLLFLVPSVILIGFGLWIIVFNIENYSQDIEEINNHKGKYCTNVRCVTIDDVTNGYEGYFGWGIGFTSVGGIILAVSRKWWK